MTFPLRSSQQSSHSTSNPSSLPHAPRTSQPTAASTRASKPSPAPTTAAQPAVRTFFDPWNSSSTGHQRAENRLSGSTLWRDSRNLKLRSQYKGGLTGGKRLADTIGAGSEGFGKDGRKENGGWENGAKGLRTGGQRSLAEAWGASRAGKTSLQDKDEGKDKANGHLSRESPLHVIKADQDTHDHDCGSESSEKQIFTGLCFYVNGSTAPLISDHKLKQLLAKHGARHSIALGRRTVTHVMLNPATSNGGAGGGLASTKIQKEIARTRGKAVKFITASWVLDSIKANRRLPESQYSPLKLAPKTQANVFGMSRATTSSSKPNQKQG